MKFTPNKKKNLYTHQQHERINNTFQKPPHQNLYKKLPKNKNKNKGN